MDRWNARAVVIQFEVRDPNFWIQARNHNHNHNHITTTSQPRTTPHAPHSPWSVYFKTLCTHTRRRRRRHHHRHPHRNVMRIVPVTIIIPVLAVGLAAAPIRHDDDDALPILDDHHRGRRGGWFERRGWYGLR
jgi:hypothetical protein